MIGQLADLIDPIKLVERQSFFKDKLALSGLERLKGLLMDDVGDAAFELLFCKQGKFATICGFVNAHLLLKCQTCLEKIVLPVQSQINLAVVSSVDDANSLPESYEPLLLAEKGIAIKDIIEDELLLALPIVPKHNNCRPRLIPAQGLADENPFAILSQLKNHGDH